MKPAHRDDVPPELLEELQRRFPGFKIVCVGDKPTNDPRDEGDEAFERLQAAMDKSLCEGLCLDCGKQMPGFPQTDEDWDEFQPPKGWRDYKGFDGEPSHWQCPECDQRLDDTAITPVV